MSTDKAGRPQVQGKEPSMTRSPGINYLLVIAIDAYQHCPRLYNCVKDARAFIEVMTEKYQCSPAHVYTLFDEAATEKGILDILRQMVQRVGPEDNLIIYYSGHGEFEKDIKEGYWVPVDAPVGHSGEYISNSRIAKFVRAFRAHHVLLLVDSCFSGALFATRQLEDPAARLDSIPSRWVFTSGRNQVVSDGQRGEHSPFAENLLYFLRSNEAPAFSISDLINRVVNAVVYDAEQTPRGEPLQNVGHKGGQFFFYQKGVVPDRPPPLAPTPTVVLPDGEPSPPSPPPARRANSAWWVVAAALLILVPVGIWFLGPSLGSRTVEEEPAVPTEVPAEPSETSPEVSPATEEPAVVKEPAEATRSAPPPTETRPAASPFSFSTNMQAGGRLRVFLRGGAPPYTVRVVRRQDDEEIFTGRFSAQGEQRIDLREAGLRGRELLVITIRDASGQEDRQPLMYFD
jgi:hypothetical protein